MNAAVAEFHADLISEAALAQSIDSYEERRGLTFRQAEGAEALPSQLQRDQLTPRLRAKLWSFIYRKKSIGDSFGPSSHSFSWHFISRSIWVNYFEQMIDDFPGEKTFLEMIKEIFKTGSYLEVFGLLQCMVSRLGPCWFNETLNNILEEEGSAFRIVNNDTFCPVGSLIEANAVQAAIDETSQSNLYGVRTHLIEAGKRATAMEFADSVRASIHAVESAARNLGGPDDSLKNALAKLEAKGVIHAGMKKAFVALYGYTSDEKGIRHALLDQTDAQVTEADALFMLGACASFVTYMFTRARAAGLLTEA